ncbi:MAG: DUF3021 family protein [Lachnospiraceae bacterium]|nr:DUF3021 family protein [Lachnospiraceae bacterium]
MKNDKKLSPWEIFLTREIGIEFKACLYFFTILFYYCMYRIICGIFDAGIIHMAEMIITCYIVCYIQVYLFGNFDEAEKPGIKEIAGVIVCSALYILITIIGNWFDGKIGVTVGFAVYLLVVYICIFLIYRIKRKIEDKTLNEDLKLFQAEHKK